MSTLKVTSVQHASAASAAITLASDGTAAAQVSSLNDGPLSGTRNRIINGDMRIDQRNAGASVTPSGSGSGDFTLDRWVYQSDLTGKFAVQRSTIAPAGFTNSLLATSQSAYSVISTSRYIVGQRIEGFNTADLDWGTANAKTIIVSFWARSSLTGTFGGVIFNDGGTRNYGFTYLISSANTWEYKTVTIPGDTSGTWDTSNSTGIQVSFSLGVGSSNSAAAGSWGTANIYGVNGQVNVVGTNGATFYITGVQLEAGSVATPFERRSYGQELALCQRYCEVITPLYLPATYDGSIFRSGRLSFATTKRANPDSSLSGTAQWAIPGLNAFSANSITAFTPTTSTTGFHVYQNRQAGGATPTAGNFYLLETVPTITFSAEL
jgi:hypothetical protein